MALKILLLQREEWVIRLNKKPFITRYLKDRRNAIIIFAACIGISIFLYYLYDVRLEPILYTVFLIVLLVIPFACWDCRCLYRKYKLFQKIKGNDFPIISEFMKADTLLEQSYQQTIKYILQVWQEERALQKRIDTERDDYYTLWTHQIKTPIYAMDLMLQTGDMTPARWKGELLKISQYVDMALKYLQLENQYCDLRIESVEVLPLVQEAVKKFSAILIAKRLKINLSGLDGIVLTDRKWLLFILEQLISNSAKYTEQGTITVYQPVPLQLCVHDTGIGIAPEDLPRLFEKGYTGFNGRIYQKSTGCGLYMCKKVAHILGCTLSVSSKLYEGTEVTVTFPDNNFHIEE